MIIKKTQAVFLIFVLAVPVFGIQNKIIIDDLGYSHVIDSPPKRIISLAPNITEILFALSLGEKVVGVTRYCDYPREAKQKEKIGGMTNPSLEKIIALNPDLIVGFQGNTLRILERLRSLHLPVFAIEMGKTIESVFLIINTIGAITQKEEIAKILIQSLKNKYAKIQSALQDIQHEPKVFITLHGMGLWTCGKDSFIDDLVRKAKGLNIAGKIQRRWLPYNREQLIHEDPEFIIIISNSQEEFSKTKEWIKKKAHLESIRAVEKENIYFLDANLATRPGPRIIEALDHLARILHPQYFETKK